MVVTTVSINTICLSKKMDKPKETTSRFLSDFINKIICGDCIDVLKDMPDECIQTCVTSPPYWGLRKYAGDQDRIWGGSSNCKHEYGESPFCQLCGAWRGSLGLEPTPEMFVEHIVGIFREVRRVLRKDGTLWLNIASTYISEQIESDDMILKNDLTSDEVEYVLKELAKHAKNQ